MEANSEMMKELAEKFKNSETVKALDRYFSEKSMMEVLGVDRDENAHSNFLAWLFENEVTGKEACRLLIEILNRKAEQKEIIPQTFSNLCVTKVQVIREDYVCSQYTKKGDSISECESNQNGERVEGRADLLININNGEAYIVIENKVLSKEECKWCSTKDKPGKANKTDIENAGGSSLWQTQFYRKYYSKNNYKDKVAFVFLTLPNQEETQPNQEAKCKDFIHVTYQDIMDSILVPVLGGLACSNHPTEEIQIKDYIKALGIRYSQDEVMAVEPYFRELLAALKIEFPDLFIPESWSQKDGAREQLIDFWNSQTWNGVVFRDILRPSIKALYSLGMTKLSEDTSKTNYKYKKEGIPETIKIGGKNPLFKCLVRKFIVQYSEDNSSIPSVELLQQMFPASLHGKTRSAKEGSPTDKNIILDRPKTVNYKEISEKGDLNKHEQELWEDFWEDFKKNKDIPSIYICQTGWDGPAMMSRLIRYVKETIPKLKDIEILEIPKFLQKKEKKIPVAIKDCTMDRNKTKIHKK